MMQVIIKIGLAVLFLSKGYFALAQKQDAKKDKKPQPFTANLQLTAKVYGDSVVLRWAPDMPGAWTAGNQYGYILERTEVPATGTFDPTTYQQINTQTIKPWPLDKWAGIAGKNSNNSMTAIAAQALYGKSFSASGASFVQMADEYSNRWSFALLAADMDPATAFALGLRFTDKTIKPGSYYIYRVTCLADSSIYKIEPGFTVVNTKDRIEIPQPFINKAIELENAIQLEWDRDFHDKVFSAYWIERSDDNGKTFKKLTQVPFLNPQNSTRSQSNSILYTDSVKDNYVLYWYRISGITSFGEKSLPSEPIRAMGRDKTPPVAPEKVKAESLGKGRIKLTWEKKTIEKDFKGFYIGRSNSAKDGFVPMFEKPLASNIRSWIDETADATTTNYYVVAAVDTAGNGNVSMISYGMIIDSLPPKPPVGLKGSIDSLGIVKISWSIGREPDLAGYMIYFSNSPDHVFSSTTIKPLRDTLFRDTIPLKNLSEKIYYKVKAVDVNYNYSAFSEMLVLKKPDRIPPTSPVFSNYKVSDHQIRIDWIPSQSLDVSEHQLYRKTNSEKWLLYKKFSQVSNVQSFIDADLSPGSQYSYYLVAIDDDKNISKPSVELSLKFTGNLVTQGVNNIYITQTSDKKAVLLNWNYPVSGKYRFVIYRAVNGGNFQTVDTNVQNILNFTDKNVKEGNTYEYQVRVFFVNGKKSALGKIVKIKI